MEISDCHFMQIEYVTSQLESHIEKGLTQVEAERRFKEHGPNELAKNLVPVSSKCFSISSIIFLSLS